MVNVNGMNNSKRNKLKGLGINVINPPEDPYPSHSLVAPYDSSSYNFNSDAMERNTKLFNEIKNNAFKTTGDSGIMRQAHSTFYKNAPQQHIRNFRNFINQENTRRLVTFDIETVGDFYGEQMDAFSPTEFYFSQREVNKMDNAFKLSKANNTRGFLISPGEDTINSLRNTLKKAEQGKSLTKMESLSLGTLVRYSGDIKTDENGIISHNLEKLNEFTTSTNSGRHLLDTSNPQSISAARDGLNNLIRKGMDPDEAAQQIGNYLNDSNINGAFFSGHNIGKFDVNVMEKFLGQYGTDTSNIPDANRQFDTYGLMKSIFPEPMSLTRLEGVSTEDVINATEKTGGGFTLDAIAETILDDNELNEFYAHKASSDVKANELVTQKLFFEKDAFNYITEDVMREPNSELATTPAYSFDIGNIQQNELLFSTRGYRSGQEGMSFVAEQTIDGDMKLTNDRWALPSQKPLMFQKAYQTESGVYGVELYNPYDKTYHYINRESREEVENFVNKYMKTTDDMSYNQIRRYTENAREDAARRTIGKLFHTPSTRGFQHLDKFMQAAEEESKVRAGKTGMSIDEFYNKRLPEIFSFENKNGEKVVMESFTDKYRRVNERLMSEHAFVRSMMNDIEENIPVTGKNKWENMRQRHRALVEAYSEYENDFGAFKRLSKVPDYRQYSSKIPGPQGGQKYIPLNQFDDTRGRLMSAFKNISPSRAMSVGDKRSYANSIIDTVEKQVRTFDDALDNLNKAHRLAFYENLSSDEAIRRAQQYSGDRMTAASEELINFLNKTKNYLPEDINAEQRIKELYDNPNVVRQQIDVLSKQLGLQTQDGVVNSLNNTDEMLDELNNVRKYVQRQNSPFYMASSISSFMHKYKDDIPGFKRPFREVENTMTAPHRRVSQALNNASDYARKGIQRAQFTKELSRTGAKLDSAFDLEKKLRILDENMNRTYRELGISNTPNTMTKQASDLISRFSNTLGDVDVEGHPEGRLGMNVFFKGSVDQDPTMTLALYDSNRFETLSGKKLSDLKSMDNVATIDVPLISTDQYIKFGNQKVISPAAILNRSSEDISRQIANGNGVKVQSAFDIISENLKRRTTKISAAVKQGDIREAERTANRAIRGSIEELTGANHPFSEVDRFATETMSDQFKKSHIMFGNVFQDGDGNWYNIFNPDSKGKLPRMNPQDKIRLFQKEGGYRSQFDDFLKTTLGKDVSVNIAGTRGKNIGKGVMALRDVRDYTSLGYYNNPGRERMLQAFNIRKLTDRSKSSIAQMEGVTFNPLMVSETMDEAFGVGDTIEETMYNTPGFQSRVAFVNEDEMLAKLRKSLDEGYGTEADRRLFEKLETTPTIFEDQALGSRELLDNFEAQTIKKKTFKGYKNPDLLDDIKKQIDETGKYKLDYMEDMIETSGDTIKSEFRSQHSIIDYQKQGDDLILTLQEEFSDRQGFTSVMLGQEKQTVTRRLSDDLLENTFGKGVKFVAATGQKSHGSYGDVLSGTVKDAVRQINELDIKQAEKSRRLKQVQDLTNEIMGLNVQIKTMRSGEDVLGRLVYRDKTGKDIIDMGTKDLLDELNKIDDINLDPNVLTMDTRFLQNEENMNYLSMFGNRGKKGMRATPQLADRMRDMKYNEYAKYLEDEITRNVDTGKQQLMIDELRAQEHIYNASRKVNPNFVPEGKSAMSYSNVVENFGRLPQGTYAGTGKRTEFQQGKYFLEDLKGTILDPNRQGMYIELPEEVSVKVDKRRGKEKWSNIRKMFMAQPDVNATDEVGRGDLYTAGPLGRHQRNIIDTIQDYNMAKTQKEGWEEISKSKYNTTDNAESLRKIRKRLNREVQKYYNRSLQDVFNSRSQNGRAAKSVVGTQASGSGYFLLQGRTPIEDAMPESAYSDTLRDVKARHADDLAVNDVLISTDDAKRMAGYDFDKGQFVNEDARKTFKQMTKGEGVFGTSVRYPTTHAGSAVPVKIKASDDIGSGVVQESALMTTQMQKGDYDTDKVALFMMPGKNTDAAKNRNINFDELEREYKKVQDDIYNQKFGSELTPAQEFRKEIQEEVNTSRGYNIIGDTDSNVVKRLEGASGVAKNFADNLAEAKMRNSAYTGMITNLADKARRIGMNNLGEAGYEKYGRDFLSAIGDITMQPIDAKHFMDTTSSGTTKSVSKANPMQVYNALQNIGKKGGWQELDELLHQSEDSILSDRQWEAFNAALGDVSSSEMNDLANDIHKSSRMFDRGLEPAISAIKSNSDNMSKQRQMMDELVFGQVKEDLVNQGSKYNYGDQARRFMGEQADKAENLNKIQKELGKVTANSIKSSSGFGAGAVAGAFVGGLALSELGSTHEPLPMDYLDQPAMQSVPDTGERQSYAHIQDMAGFKQALSSYGNQANIQGPTDIPDMVKQENMNMVVKGKTTMDKDPDELARIVNEEFKNELQFPININVNTEDDREGLSSEWAEQKVLDMIN